VTGMHEPRWIERTSVVCLHVVADVLALSEQIEELHAELQLDALGAFEVLVDTHLHVPRRRSGTDSDSRSSDLSQLVTVDGEHIGIEPGFGVGTTRAAGYTCNTIRTVPVSSDAISYTGGIAESLNRYQRCNRRSGGRRDDRAGFPSTQHAPHEPI